MRKLAVLRTLGICVSSWLASAGLFAQESPTEWTFSLGARESNELSRITDGVEGEGRVMDGVNASLGLTTRRERDQVGLFGRVGANVNREAGAEDRGRLNFGAGLSWDRQFSTQSHSMLMLGVDRGLRAETLSSLGVIAPGIDTFTTTAAWSLQHQATPRTSFSTSLSYRRLRLESDEPILGSQIVPDEPPFPEEFPPLPSPSDDGGVVAPDVEDDVVDVIATEGLSATLTDSHAAFAGFGVNRRLTEYSSFGVDLNGGYRTLDHGSTGEEDRQDGAQGGLRVWVQRRSGPSSTYGSSYQASRSLVVDPEVTIQNLVGSYSYARSGSSVALSVSAGASHYQAESGPSRITPVVNGSFSAGITRSTSFGAAYRRQFSQSLGFGRTLLIDYANVSLTQSFGTRVDLTARAGGTFAEDPLIEGSSYDAIQMGGVLSWRILESLSVGTSFFDVRREQNLEDGISESSRKMWTVFINYTARWR
jgi:hypothetical protein